MRGALHYGRTTYGRIAAALQPSQKARARFRVVNFWGVGGPIHRAQRRTKRAPTVRPIFSPSTIAEADRRHKPDRLRETEIYMYTQGTRRIFRPASRCNAAGPKAGGPCLGTVRTWQATRPGKLRGRDIGERMGAGAPVASGRARLGRKTGV